MFSFIIIQLKQLKIAIAVLTVAVAGFLTMGGDITPPDITPEINEISPEKIQQKYDQAVEIKAKYNLEDGALVRETKSDPKDRIEVTIGNKIDPKLMGATNIDFEPTITLSRWDEVDFKITPNLEGVATKDKTLEFVGDKIRFGTPKMDYEFYEYTEGEGGYKFIWYLNEKPNSNVIEFQIESSGLDFLYQPSVIEEIGQEGIVTATEMQGFDKDGNVVVERPENVVGSYAVYHQTKGKLNDVNGKDYKVGKLGHIYRPKLIDSNGWEVWGELNIDIQTGTYNITIPEDFYNNAIYPIKSNDTFGYTSKGSGTSSTNYNVINGTYGTMAFDGTVTKITAWYDNGWDANEPITGALYDSDAARLDLVTEERWGAGTKGEEDFDFDTPPELLADDYFVLMWSDDIINWNSDSGDSGNVYNSGVSYDGWPATVSHTSSYRRSFYATYTPGGAAAAPEPQMQVIIVN